MRKQNSMKITEDACLMGGGRGRSMVVGTRSPFFPMGRDCSRTDVGEELLAYKGGSSLPDQSASSWFVRATP